MGARRRQTLKGPARYRFRPRYPGLAWSAAVLGGGLVSSAIIFGMGGASLLVALVSGGVGLALGTLYLVSPAWRIEVAVDDEALEVLASGDRRFRLPWGEIERVVASFDTRTCFVDGGDPERSLLLPGPGARAPYRIEDREALFAAIVERAPAPVIERVGRLKDARVELGEDRPPPGPGDPPGGEEAAAAPQDDGERREKDPR